MTSTKKNRPGQPAPAPAPSEDRENLTNRGIDRGAVIGDWVASAGKWSWRTLPILALLFVLLWLLSKVSMAVVPLMFALLLTSVLWKPVGWLERHKVPRVAGAILSLLVTFLLVGGLLAAVAPMVAEQSGQLADKATEGLTRLQQWAEKPPLNLKHQQISDGVDKATQTLKNKSGTIIGGVFTGLSTLTSLLVNAILVLMMSIFMLKDGPAFLPGVRRVVGREAGRHVTEAGTRVWRTLSGYIRTQAIVSTVDAVLIGAGLFFTGTPLWPVLAIITFLGGFIPMVGAVVAGLLAVLVALVAKGPVVALIVLGIVILVQQLEGNVLTPWLQGQAMDLHALIVLVAVTIGGTLFGIAGAFFAVPVAAAVMVVLRYAHEQIDLITGDLEPAAVEPVTVQGERILEETTERRARAYLEAPTEALPDDQDTPATRLPQPPFWSRVRAVFFPGRP